MTLLRLAAAVALPLLATAAPAHAMLCNNSLALNGLSSNALSANSLTLNGLTYNALTANSLTLNGLTSNALTANSLTLNGFTYNALAANPLSLNALLHAPLLNNARANTGSAVGDLNGVAVEEVTLPRDLAP